MSAAAKIHSNGSNQIIDIGREITETPAFQHALTQGELDRIRDVKWREQAMQNSVVDQRLDWTTTVAVLNHNKLAKIDKKFWAIIGLVGVQFISRVPDVLHALFK